VSQRGPFVGKDVEVSEAVHPITMHEFKPRVAAGYDNTYLIEHRHGTNGYESQSRA